MMNINTELYDVIDLPLKKENNFFWFAYKIIRHDP